MSRRLVDGNLGETMMNGLGMAVAIGALLMLPLATEAREKPQQSLPKVEQAEEEALVKASVLLSQGQPDAARQLVEPLIDAHDRQAAGEKRRIFSARTFPEMMDYMLGAAGRHEDSVVMSRSWGLALYIKGFALIDLRKGDEAKLFLDRAVALSPDNAHYLGELAEWYKARGRLDEALAVFKRAQDATQFSPDEFKVKEKTRAMRGVGWIAVEQGRLDDAAETYRQCLALDPEDQRAKSELAYIAEQKARAIR